MNIMIKNMVCDRCIMAVRQQFEDACFNLVNIKLGEVTLAETLSADQMEVMKTKLAALGFEVVDDRKSTMINKIKSLIIELIHQDDHAQLNKKLSIYLAEKLNVDYHYLSTLFSSIEGITIEKYVILQRVERAKELIAYDQLNLNQISFDLGYSSVQHLSLQFKKVTGLTPTQYKQLKDKQRTPLDKVV